MMGMPVLPECLHNNIIFLVVVVVMTIFLVALFFVVSYCQCAAVKCGVPSTGNHSTFSGSNFTYQSSVNYTCNLGYHISGMTPSNTMVTSTCLVNGSWSRTAPSCQSKSLTSIVEPICLALEIL